MNRYRNNIVPVAALLLFGSFAFARLLAPHLSDRRTAFVSAALFAICAFVVYLQRLALSDTLVCSAGVWILASVIRFIESPTRPHAALVTCGPISAVFCKFPVGFVFLISLPLALLLMPAPERRQPLHRFGTHTRLAIYELMRVGP